MSQLSREFFNRNTVLVAKELLGKYLVRKIGRKIIRTVITETEAYCGQKDKACHASKGLTPRTKTMFGPPGHAYVYMIYGMYHCLNVVTREEGCPEAVLIRATIIQNSTFVSSSGRGKIKTQNDPFDKTQGYPEQGRTDDNAKLKSYLNGPGILCRELKIDKSLNGSDLCKSRELWIGEGEKVKTSQIKKGKRIGVDYAGEWKDKLWRFWI